MSCPTVNTLRACLIALALGLSVTAHCAEKEKPASLVGLSQDEVFARLGEPRSQMKAGVREILFFQKIKVTLKNGVVVETEALFDETPPPKRAAEAPPAAVPAPAPAPVSAAELGETAGQRKPTPPPGATSAVQAPDASVAAKPADVTGEAKGTALPPVLNNGLEIKFVRPPAAKAPQRPSVKASPPSPNSAAPVPATQVRPAAVAVVAAPAALQSVPMEKRAESVTIPKAVAVTPPATTGPAVMTPTTSTTTVAAEPKPDAPEEPDDVTVEPVNAAKQKAKVPAKGFFRRRADAAAELPEATILTVQFYVFGAALVGAVGFLIWRARQRHLELAATTVSNTPFNEPIVGDNSAVFTADILAKLEWKRFEELVGAYYLKTGVVAVRTKAGPKSAVHLQISWKGETKPFACVQCHASPSGLIPLAPLQELHAALTAADIRRGYVVTNGKFNVEARDFAEEKHFTLLPGDLFLEKLNALPAAARAELMQQVLVGDASTASCPKCDAKMVRADDGGWRCAKCETTLAPR
jgi:hypothetical protein